MGALAPLLDEDTWRAYGELTPQECADQWQEIFFSWQTACNAGAPTPYWDDSTDVDDELPSTEQPWYGWVANALTPGELTFVEDFALWVITGFILASSGGVGIVPALFFRTNAKEFVLQHRNDNIGDVIRYFVDGSLVKVYTDTGDNSITDVPILADPAESTHPIYITVEKA